MNVTVNQYVIVSKVRTAQCSVFWSTNKWVGHKVLSLNLKTLKVLNTVGQISFGA